MYANVVQRRIAWERRYAPDEYTRLLGTFSDHLALTEVSRAALLEEIGSAIRGAGVLDVAYETWCFLYQRL
jgi:hypothetical protein